MENTKAMFNMAMSIAELYGVEIERMDLQKIHMNPKEYDFYFLDVWFSDGKKFTIREDCTIRKD